MRHAAFLTAMVFGMGLATSARADLEIQASDGTHSASISDTTLGTPGSIYVSSYTLGNLKFSNISADTNSTGAMTLGSVASGAFKIQNTGGSTVTLTVTVGSTGFTQPVTPPSLYLLSSVGGTNSGSHTGTDHLTAQSYIDTQNGQNTYGSSSRYITLGAQSINPLGTSFNNSITGVVSALHATYSITQTLTLVIGAGDTIQINGTTQLTPTPEPSTMALAGLGGLGLIGYGLRRRKARTA